MIGKEISSLMSPPVQQEGQCGEGDRHSGVLQRKESCPSLKELQQDMPKGCVLVDGEGSTQSSSHFLCPGVFSITVISGQIILCNMVGGWGRTVLCIL